LFSIQRGGASAIGPAPAAGTGVADVGVASVASVALAAGAGALAVLYVAVAAFGGGSRAGGDGCAGVAPLSDGCAQPLAAAAAAY
jgi:hypothetical protein